MEHKQSYSRGKPITILTRSELPLESKGTKGTSIRFWPDKEGFPLFTTIPSPNFDLMISLSSMECTVFFQYSQLLLNLTITPLLDESGSLPF